MAVAGTLHMAMAEPSSKKRKLAGGQRQRVAQLLSNEKAGSAEPVPPVKSLLAKDLVYKWSWGKLSPQEVQHSADLACKDILAVGGQEPLDLKGLANLGSGGKFKEKMHQQLVAIVSKGLAISTLHHCYLPFDGFEKPVFQSMLLPHILFADLFHNYQQVFQSSILPKEGDIRAFWKLQQSHPAWKKHPLSKRSVAKCIPLLLHGDGTPVISIGKLWSKQLTIFSWASMLGSGLTKDTLYHIWSVFDKSAIPATWDSFFQELSWSFNILWEGVWPSSDAKGNEYSPGSPEALKSGQLLAGGYCGVLWSITGDLDYMSGVLQLPHYSLKAGPCAICKCTGGEGADSWKDCRPEAPWTTLFWKKSDWQAWGGKTPCKLFSKTIGITCHDVFYDWMHCKHLGTDCVQFGSVLYLLIFCQMEAEPVANLKTVWQFMQKWYKEHGTTNRYFAFGKITMFYNSKAKKSPKLKGKAKQVVNLGGCLLDLWKQHMDPENDIHKKVKQMLKLNVGLERLLASNVGEFAFGPQDAQLFKQFSFAMCQLHRELAEHFLGNTPRLFPDIPKIHPLLHIALDCDKVNPALTWCYKGEDYMGCRRSLAQSCAARLQPPGVCQKMVRKIRLALHLQLQSQK